MQSIQLNDRTIIRSYLASNQIYIELIIQITSYNSPVQPQLTVLLKICFHYNTFTNKSIIDEIKKDPLSFTENHIILELDGETKYVSIKRRVNEADLLSSNSIIEFQKPKQVSKLSQLNFKVAKPDLAFSKDADQSTNSFSEFSLFK
ncbi:Hypothetical_protein [Hexamita inflata]|uniref:Hypothetical_protein n=1 Tax=Hexamita inflata TaxID=28002 RepID=A0AA86UU19_9EUKA|nr:Hypothetical protein HINF_LOCUS52261 [Hexamita inflata]